MGLKKGDRTSFYNVKTRKKETAKITKISRVKGRRSAHGTATGGTKLRKFIK